MFSIESSRIVDLCLDPLGDRSDFIEVFCSNKLCRFDLGKRYTFRFFDAVICGKSVLLLPSSLAWTASYGKSKPACSDVKFSEWPR